MSAAGQGTKQAHSYHDQQGGKKQIRWNHERDAGIVDAAQIDNCKYDEDGQAQEQGVLLQAGNCGDECADSGRDADSRSEDVVDHQRRGSEESRAFAQVLGCYGVGTAALRVGVDRLAVGEVNDHQQNNDGGRDRNDEVYAQQSERNEQRQRGFGTIGCGTERVQTKDGDTGERANRFPALLTGCERLSKEQIENFHPVSASLRAFLHLRCEPTVNAVPEERDKLSVQLANHKFV